MAEFTIGENTYRAGIFDADVHISLLLKLAPVFTALAAAMPDITAALAEVREGGDGATAGFGPEAMGPLGRALVPVSREMAALDRDGDAKAIIEACLNVTEHSAEGKWFKVRSPAGIITNRDNATYTAKLQITFAVLKQNFGPMIGGFGVDVDTIFGSGAGA